MKTLHQILALTLALCMAASMAGCAGETAQATQAQALPVQTQATEKEETKPQMNTQKPVILAVSFGTSYNESRELTIGAVEEALQEAFPDYEVRRAFTAQTIIDILKEREGLEIDNVTQAMARLVLDGVKEVIIQPTHVMPGMEYDDVIAETAVYAKQFDRFRVGEPLLTVDADYENLIAALAEETRAYNQEDTAVVFMGHGTEHEANAVYAKLQEKLTDAGYANYFIGTVEATPSLEDVVAQVKESGAKKAVLLPLMIVAGDHATNDMAGDEEDSWKTAFQNAGLQVECVLKGMGQYPGVRQMIVDHCRAAIEAPDRVEAAQLQEGAYEIGVKSSSNMFKIVKCELTVENGEMYAVMTMSGEGYGKLFMGTGVQADDASEGDCIPAVPDAEGRVTFRVPVEALNEKIDCAAWSIRKEKWYDRTLVFLSEEIPAGAITVK